MCTTTEQGELSETNINQHNSEIMKYLTIYLSILITALMITTGCDVANTGDDPEDETGAIEIQITNQSDVPAGDFNYFIYERGNSENPLHEGRVGVEENVLQEELAAGGYTVEVMSSNDRCIIENSPVQEVEVVPGNTTQVEFVTICQQSEPQQDKIVYVNNTDGYLDLYIANADGSNPVKITNDDWPERHPSLSPDGTRIAYTKGEQIWVIDIDGANAEQLTDVGGNQHPVWSPNGERIAFTGQEEFNQDIYVMNADGSERTNLTNNREWDDLTPSWSPDGTKIAFTSIRNRISNIYILDLENREEQVLTQDDMPETQPVWSPNGDELVFVSQDANGVNNLFTIDATGENRAQFTELGSSRLDEEVYPCWGSDNYIYFTSLASSDEAMAKATSHNASRSNRSQGIMEDIVTDGDARYVGCKTLAVQ